MAVPLRDMAWLAGLLEGEGCFKYNRMSPNICVVMTDEDIIRRAAKLLGTTTVTRWPLRPGRNKHPWYTGVSGNRAAGWMMTFYSFMGERRRERIRMLLEYWKSYKPRYVQNTVCGHLDRPICARGMCARCYDRNKMRRLRKKWKEQAA